MKAYKGTDSKMQCKGFQYEIGKEMAHDGDVIPCESGFHACENPLDVLRYYPACNKNRYFEVGCEGKIKRGQNDSKIVCSRIVFNAEIGLFGLIKSGVKMTFDRVKQTSPEQVTSGDWSTAATSGDWSTAATSGGWSTAATSGGWSTAATSGNKSTAATSGYKSTAATSGDWSAAATSGDWSTAATSGNKSTAATSGYESAAATSGYESTAATSGDWSTAIVEGKSSIAVANGFRARAKGKLGCYLVLSEYKNGELTDVKVVKVDGENIKEDTLYMLVDGNFVEVTEDE